jgi:hypothetical protein
MRARLWAALTIGCMALPACSLLVSLDGLSTRGDADAGIVVSAEAGGDAAGDATDAGSDAVVPACDGGGDPTLTAYFPFDDGAGSIGKDCSGKGLDGTILGTPTWVPGHLGGALAFDGVSTCIDLGAGSTKEIANGPVTIASWVFVLSYANGTAGKYIMSKSTEPANRGWRWGTDDGNVFKIAFGKPMGSTSVSSSVFPTGTWLHVAMTFVPATRGEIYVNGALSHASMAGPTFAEDAAASLLIGCRSGNNNMWHGIIDELRIYSRVLSQPEIANLAK